MGKLTPKCRVGIEFRRFRGTARDRDATGRSVRTAVVHAVEPPMVMAAAVKLSGVMAAGGLASSRRKVAVSNDTLNVPSASPETCSMTVAR